jgi:hypothetical protein
VAEIDPFSSTHSLCALLKYRVLQLILDRAAIVGGGVPPFHIIKIIDVVHNLGAGQFGRQLGVIEGQFAFECAEEGSIIPTVSSSAQAANDPAGPQRRLSDEIPGKSVRLALDFRGVLAS